MIECRTPEREVWGVVRNLTPPCCVLKQDIALPKRTGNNQEALALSRHD